MANNFEKIVRPFETGSPFSARRLPPVPPLEEQPSEPENAVKTWGKEHPGNYETTLHYVYGWTKKYTETERKTSTTRVYQNNDESSSNYVDVERIDLLKLRSNDGDEIEWQGNWGDS
jgi:hypothetical protein